MVNCALVELRLPHIDALHQSGQSWSVCMYMYIYICVCVSVSLLPLLEV